MLGYPFLMEWCSFDEVIYKEKQNPISSVTQSCLTLCNPMDCSTSGVLVHHQLLQFTQTHVHWVDDAIQPSYPPPAFNLSQHQRSQFFASGGQNIDVSALVLPVSIHGWLPLGLTDLISLQFKRLSILGYSAFFMVQLSHPYITTGKTIALTRWTFVGKLMSLLFNIGHLRFPLCFFMSYLYIFFMLKGGCSEFELGKNSYPVPPCLHLIKKC